jgi:hypothetical protein
VLRRTRVRILYTPSAAFPSLTSAGYDVAYRATGATIDKRRRLASGVKTVEKAKAIAQADHDKGNDARS